jgi:hypothetical protein
MIELATTAFQLVSWLAGQAQRMQSANSPDWAKYVIAGAYVMSQAGAAFTEQQASGTDRFDKMTPQEIRDYLTPPTWEEL